jgi:hypothetical protein
MFLCANYEPARAAGVGDEYFFRERGSYLSETSSSMKEGRGSICYGIFIGVGLLSIDIDPLRAGGALSLSSAAVCLLKFVPVVSYVKVLRFGEP